MTKDEFRQFVNRCRWQFAKTYADFAPHEYCVRDWMRGQDIEAYTEALYFLYENGFPCRYGKTAVHLYVECDGKYYWSMLDPNDKRPLDILIAERQVINRCDMMDYKMVFDFQKAKEKKQGQQLTFEGLSK